jgi:RNA polymerase sigma-70 factor (ECF subfamily)
VTEPPAPGLQDVHDGELVERCLAGDPRAFGLLVERHHSACLRYAQRMLGAREEAEEAVQDAFLRAHRALARYDERDRFRPWLFRILVNRCRTRLAALRRRWLFFAPLDMERTLPAIAPAAEPTDTGDELARALATLTPDHREAFLLRHVQDMSYEEMGAITGAGVSALKMRVKRACDQLRLQLSEP